MDCDIIDVDSSPDESTKESSYFHVHGSHLEVSLARLPFSLLWPSLLTCSSRASVTATNVNIVEWLVSMPAVRLFVGSALTISFGLASRGYNFDRSTFDVLFQKV